LVSKSGDQMSRIPNFAQIDFADTPARAAPAAAAPWLTPEGIEVASAYGADALKGLDALDTYPGIAPYLRGP
jgi:methylmalonyl-CoA mutase